jgi:hypothetical protein
MQDHQDHMRKPVWRCPRHTGSCLCRPPGFKKPNRANQSANAASKTMTLDAVIPRDGDGLTFRYFAPRGNGQLPHLPDEVELLRADLAQEIDDILF